MKVKPQKRDRPAATGRIADENQFKRNDFIPPLPGFQPDWLLFWGDAADLQTCLGRQVGWLNVPLLSDLIKGPLLSRFKGRDGRRTWWLASKVDHGFVAYGNTADDTSVALFMLMRKDGYPTPKPSIQNWEYAATVASIATRHDIAAGVLEAAPC